MARFLAQAATAVEAGRMDRWFFVICIFAVAVTSLARSERGDGRPPVTPAGYENGVAVPFEVEAGFLVVVSGRIGARSGLRFILDTGATRSIIDRHLIAGGTSTSKAFEVFSFDRRLEMERATVDRIEVGPIHATNPEIEVTRLSEYSELAKNIDGIVGMDLLGANEKILIDYEGKVVWFSSADVEAKPTIRPRCFFVRVNVQGVPFRLAVDTGFEGVAVYEDRLRAKLPNLRTDGGLVSVEMGPLKTTKVRVPDVWIGGPSETADILLVHGRGENEVDGIDGYLGIAALHATAVEFDFANGHLRWK